MCESAHEGFARLSGMWIASACAVMGGRIVRGTRRPTEGLGCTMTTPANLSSGPFSRALIAPAWHTIVFIGIFIALSVVGNFFQHAVKQRPQATVRNTNAVPGYVSVLISELLLVLYVRMGIRKRGVRLRDLVGGRWATPADVIKDIALGAALWALWTLLQNSHLLGGGTNAAQGLLPQGTLESLVWIPLALSAGFSEELAFRGYPAEAISGGRRQHRIGRPFPSDCIRRWPPLGRSRRGNTNHSFRRLVRAARCMAA